MRVLITGGSGFIGTNLVTFHGQRGDEVLNIDNRPPRDPAQRSMWKQVDLLDKRSIHRAFEDFSPTLLLHFGARTDLHGSDLGDYETNTTGLENLIEATSASKALKRAIFASSRMVCQIDHRPEREDEYSPPNAYGGSKAAGERIIRGSKLEVPWTIVRPTSIWGPWFDIPYKSFFLAIARGRYVHVKDHSVGKSFGYVGNTVHQLYRIASAPEDLVAGRTLYLGDYPPIDTRDMAERIRAEIEAPPIRTVPLSALRLAARAGDAARRMGWPEPPLTSFRLNNLITDMIYDLDSLKEVAGDLPYTLDEGIRATVHWLREAGEIGTAA